MITKKMILDAVKEALTMAFTTWLNENKNAVLQIVSSSMVDEANVSKVEKSDEPIQKDFFTPTQIAIRWNFHTESVRRLLRAGALPTVRIGRHAVRVSHS